MALKGGTCAGNNPTGLTYEVLDNYIINPSAGLGAGYSGGADSDDTNAGPTAVAASSSAVAVTSASRAVTTSAQPVAVTSAQQADTSSELAATTDSAVRSLRYSFSTVVQDADISPSATNDIVLVAVQSSGCTGSSAADAAETSRTSTCTFGAWQCSGLELQVCNYLTVDSLGELFYTYGAPGRRTADKHTLHEVGKQSKPVGQPVHSWLAVLSTANSVIYTPTKIIVV